MSDHFEKGRLIKALENVMVGAAGKYLATGSKYLLAHGEPLPIDEFLAANRTVLATVLFKNNKGHEVAALQTLEAFAHLKKLESAIAQELLDLYRPFVETNDCQQPLPSDSDGAGGAPSGDSDH